MENNKSYSVNLNVDEMILFNQFVDLVNVREILSSPHSQALLNDQSKIQAVLLQNYEELDYEHEEMIDDAKQSIQPWIYFKTFFDTLLDKWEEERKDDSTLPSATHLTRLLWGGVDDRAPYYYLSDNDNPQKIIMAIEGYISEYQDSDAWRVMDAWIQAKTYSDLEYLNISEVIETFDGVIHREARPDLDD